MKILLGAIAGFILFNLFVGYIMWDFTWFTHLGEYSNDERFISAFGSVICIALGVVCAYSPK